MKKAEFWLVELGVRMGPLVLGTEYQEVLQVLREHRIDADRLTFNGPNILPLPEIGIRLVFSQTSPRTLCRVDVTDEGLRFASLSVIGKRVHEIIGIFKISRKETLWCRIDADGFASNAIEHDAASRSREQLASGTIWLPSLGLGLTLRDGLIATVHLCDPAQSPRVGDGPWTKEKQRLSEVRELPAASTTPAKRNLLSRMIKLLGRTSYWKRTSFELYGLRSNVEAQSFAISLYLIADASMLVKRDSTSSAMESVYLCSFPVRIGVESFPSSSTKRVLDHAIATP